EAELHVAITSNGADWQRRAFDEYHGLVHGLLLKTLGPHAEIADLVGDVFVMFFANAHRIRLPSAVRSYLVSITMNVARRELRARRRRRLLHNLIGWPRDSAREASPDDPKAKAALRQLSGIVDELSPEERTAFVLHSLENMELAEIARVLGVSESTAKRRVRRANEHLLKRVGRNALLADYLVARSGPTDAD
ncbi:MAG: sigma-70 family RNA polymerase sigma factor, partial [Polyangiaceae bacterium]